MSKSVGNFIILEDAIGRWGADATRFALADAGDGLEDANFERETADNAILRLTTEQEWAAETIVLGERGGLRTGELLVRGVLGPRSHVRRREPSSPFTPLQYADKVFDAKINVAVRATGEAYAGMRYRDAIQVWRVCVCVYGVLLILTFFAAPPPRRASTRSCATATRTATCARSSRS